MGLASIIKSTHQGREAEVFHRTGVLGELVNGATVNLFTITGNPIVASMYGVITALMDANATTVQLRNALIVMSLASGALNGQIVGIHLNPTGAVGAAIAISAGAGVGVFQPTNLWSLSPATINILVGGATQVTGIIDWYLLVHVRGNAGITIL